MMFSYLNFKKSCRSRGKDPFEVMILELLLFGGFFVHFDLGGMNLHPGAAFPGRKSADFVLRSSGLCQNSV
jgi:hypothetical protein